MILFFFIILVIALLLFYFILNIWDKHKLKRMRREYGRTEERAEEISRDRRIDIESAGRIAESELGNESTDRAIKPKRRSLFQGKSFERSGEDVYVNEPSSRIVEQTEGKDRGKEIREKVSSEVASGFLSLFNKKESSGEKEDKKEQEKNGNKKSKGRVHSKKTEN